MSENVYLAVDLGASGGRVFAGLFDGQSLRLDELHRFEHAAIPAAGSLYWDVLALWREILNGLRAGRAKYGARVRSVGVDAWGVDFGLLGRGDTLLGNPHSYRDPRTQGVMQRTLERVDRQQIYSATGVQFMPINTLYQVMAMRERQSPLLDVSRAFVMIPDLFHWLLTGEQCNEFTNATTTQMFDPTRRGWATDLLSRLELPTDIFPRLVEPGTKLGRLRPSVAEETGLSGVTVTVPATHDTASAVLAVPAASSGGNADWCYLSSGTWALMGVESPVPVLSPQALRYNFTNEGGVGRTTRLLKNITGLWLVQECRRTWAAAGNAYRWDALAKLAAEAPSAQAFIDPDAAEFSSPCDMPEVIRTFCRRTGQPVPADDGWVVRVCLESIAMRSRQVLTMLEELTGRRLATIHVVGGGSQNRLLCQMTADACQRRVVTGPVEATVIGNVLMQAMTDGQIGSIAEAREVVGRSFPVEVYEPSTQPSEHFARFLAAIGS